jgi:NAD(P)-dependent dehydrogenase (short-subunit alcohol dehydrogenase family)
MSRSYVVTGGGRGVGRAVVERLLGDSNIAVAIELDPESLDWTSDRSYDSRVIPIIGDASDEAVAEKAADVAQDAASLAGWVNNAAVFRDASFHWASTNTVLELIDLNLKPAVVGCATAIRRFLASGGGGAIVNVSSHQVRRAVPGCMPYVTAKAAIEGLTRALAVEYGSLGIRVNAVALGSIGTERYRAFLEQQDPDTAVEIEREMRRLHPIGRVGRPDEAAASVVHLLSDDASFINGATIPVDGGRAVLARDPEAHHPTP